MIDKVITAENVRMFAYTNIDCFKTPIQAMGHCQLTDEARKNYYEFIFSKVVDI